MTLPGDRWVLRVFIPLQAGAGNGSADSLTGYFEGVRIVPAWQQEQIRHESLIIALIVGFASLLCGAVIYPVVVHLSSDNERKAREVLESHISMMEALGRAIARRDSDTGAHNYRVAWIAAQIANQLGEQGSSMQALIIGSFLHDVGKIGIPDAILLKPGRLDDEEMKVMRTHVALGAEIVNGIGWLEHASEIVLGHHEKWDGSGYPNAQAAESIPLGARIFAVADVFDALTSKRPYKEAFDYSSAIEIIARDSGSHFDPAVVGAFLKIAPDIHKRLSSRDEQACRQLLAEEIRLHFGL
jgi:putative nucleotidyltransferase with HDIG domain